MKRDVDLVRDLLLEIEEKDIGDGRTLELGKRLIEESIVIEHLFLMKNADFVEGCDFSSTDGRNYKVFRLTWKGQDFLDSVRDPEIWQKTKDGAKAAGGYSIEILGDLAKGFIKTQIKKATGVELSNSAH